MQTESSVKMWEEYFPNATIYGFDIDQKCTKFENGRVKIIIGDQNKLEDLKKIPGDLDVIIDDGSHVEEHVIKTFNYLFTEKLNIGGKYIIFKSIS